MSYKPDESILISWLYGELDESEKAKVDRYFQENPDELKKMRQFGDVKDIMGMIKDKEVIAPPIEASEANVVPLWRTNSFRIITTIAASILLIMVVGKLLNVQVSYGDSELRIAFGEKQVEKVDGLTAYQVQQMIDKSVAQNRSELDEAIKVTLASNSEQINDLVKKAAANASREDIRTFVATLQRDNLAQMRDYLQLSSADQRKYTDNLIVEFSKFLQEQRVQDLNMYQTRFSRLEQNTDELKTETEQILASIISNSPQVQQSSY